MNDSIGKYIAEEAALERLLRSFPILSRRIVTEEAAGDVPSLRDPPDFVIGFDGVALGIELTAIRGASDAREYCLIALGHAWKKHESYSRRGIFQMPVVLILHSDDPPLYDMSKALSALEAAHEFEDTRPAILKFESYHAALSSL